MNPEGVKIFPPHEKSYIHFEWQFAEKIKNYMRIKEPDMTAHLVSVVRYETPYASLQQAVEMAAGLEHLPKNPRVFIKPNILFWTRKTNFPKWGVITTSRVVEDTVALLKEYGVEDITIGEGLVLLDAKDRETPAHAFSSLGYEKLKQRYGVKYMNIFDRPFEKVDMGEEITLSFNKDVMESDFVVDLPVMKTHAQTVVSLGIKNLKGLIDIPSRKKCHSPDPVKDLHFMVARLADKMPPMLTIIDGIFTNERGPSIDGRMHRQNLLVASKDVLSADMTGARLLGYQPEEVPYIAHAAKNRNRPTDLSDVEVKGIPIEDAASPHEFTFPYNEEGALPKPLEKKGISGLNYYKYDSTLCTYCSGVNGIILTAISYAWKGEPWDDVEVLTGKIMQPNPEKKKTILLGKCMYQAHKDNPQINEMIPVKGCPPKPEQILKAFHQAGIMIDKSFFDNMETLPGFLMQRYTDKPEFEESFFTVS